MAKPDVQLVVKRRFQNTDESEFWAPIGDVALWLDPKKGYSGRFRDYRTGQTYNVFPQHLQASAAQAPPTKRGKGTADDLADRGEESPFG